MIFQLIEFLRGWLMPYPFWIRNLGARGEYLARRYYHRRGYHLLDRNWRHGKAELDLVMANPKHLLIIEVKTRRSPKANLDRVLGRAQEKRLLRLANRYLSKWPEEIPWRFELVFVWIGPGISHHIRSASL